MSWVTKSSRPLVSCRNLCRVLISSIFSQHQGISEFGLARKAYGAFILNGLMDRMVAARVTPDFAQVRELNILKIKICIGGILCLSAWYRCTLRSTPKLIGLDGKTSIFPMAVSTLAVGTPQFYFWKRLLIFTDSFISFQFFTGWKYSPTTRNQYCSRFFNPNAYCWDYRFVIQEMKFSYLFPLQYAIGPPTANIWSWILAHLQHSTAIHWPR